MTLRRSSLTAAARIMIPAYPVLHIAVGLTFILQSPLRTSSEAFDVAKMLLPIPAWGLIFLAIGVIEMACLVAQRRHLFILGLAAGAGLATFWTGTILGSALTGDTVSFTSVWWLAFVVLAHAASARSLAIGER